MSLEASIIIPTFNRNDTLDLSLGALARQSVGAGTFEVIVADDGSSQDTMAVVRNYEDRLAIKYVYYPDHGYHVTRARNMGIRVAEGDVLIFLDCGNLVSTSFVHAHVVKHQTEDCACIGYIYGFDHSDDNREEVIKALNASDIDASIERMQRDVRLHDVREQFYGPASDKLDDVSMSWALFWGGNISARAAHVRAVGGFDERFVAWGGEDIEFGLALSQHGLPLHLLRDASAIQFPHAKDVEKRAPGYYRNKTLIHEKWKLPETLTLIDGSHTKIVLDSIQLAVERR